MRLNVSYYKQEKSITCGPACVRMILAYNDLEINESDIEKNCETSWLGNTCEELASGSIKLGLNSEVLENITKEILLDFLHKEVPIIALIDTAELYGGIQGIGHFIVIIGFTDEHIQIHDPDMDENILIGVEKFFNAWKKYYCKEVKIWKSMKK